MESTQVIKKVNLEKIASVKFKFPALMDANAEQMVIDCHASFIMAKNALYDARDKVHELEEVFEAAKKAWTQMQELAEIEYEVEEVEVDAPKRNSLMFKGYGNSILGYDNH